MMSSKPQFQGSPLSPSSSKFGSRLTEKAGRMEIKFHHLDFTCCLPFPENNTMDALDGFL
jgi:hypothetical protein